MGFLLFAGLIGTMAYGTYFAKNEAKAIIGDAVLTPTHILAKDKEKINTNFKLICNRCGIKLDNDNNPIHKKQYKPCVAYLQYQGFQQPVVDYFQKIYLQKYEQKHKDKTHSLQLKHNDLDKLYFEQINQKETKVIRYWHRGDTQKKCQKMMDNFLWNHLVDYYNIVDDGYQQIEVWTISAPPSILKQIDDIYYEVQYLEDIKEN